MKKFTILFLMPLIVFFSGCRQKHKQQPNIIYILADDLGWGDLSFLGQKSFETPNIDKLAADGLFMSNYYTGSTVCAPSRAALLTGKHTGHTTIRTNSRYIQIAPDEMTIPKMLKSVGYKTGCIGKWGVGDPVSVNDPRNQGFDYFYGYVNMWHAHNFYPEFLYRNGEKVKLRNKLRLNKDGSNPWAHMPEGAGVADVRVDYVPFLFDKEALNFIEQNKKNPFFLYLTYNTPHANNENKKNGSEVPSYGEFSEKDWPDVEKGFAKMITNLDNSVGMIVKKLQESGIEDNTLIMFSSDNGPHQEGGHIMEYFNSNGDLRGKKRDFYDGGVRTPFIVKWKDQIKAGRTSNHLSAFWDVLPTLCEIVGEETPQNIDGVSFLPTLLDNGTQKQHDYLYWEFFKHGGKQAIVRDNWKAVRLHLQNPEKTKLELYDLKNDISEVNDISAKHPEIVKQMEELFKQARTEYPEASLFQKSEGMGLSDSHMKKN